MKHLSPEQMVDLADGCADARAAVHAASCETCRAKAEALRQTVRLAEADDDPGPSPLFWPHLAARIGEAVRRESVPSANRRPWVWRLAPGGALAILVVAAVIGFRSWGRPSADAVVTRVPAGAASAQISAETGPQDGLADDPSWLLVSGLASELSVEGGDTSDTPPSPGDVDAALLQLDDAERAELAKILRDEMAPVKPANLQGPGA